MQTTTQRNQVWDLDSLYRRPDSDEFGSTLAQFHSDLTELAAESESLVPPSTATAAAWQEFLARYQDVRGRWSDLYAFIGCHAAAEAENREFQKLEARLASFSPPDDAGRDQHDVRGAGGVCG